MGGPWPRLPLRRPGVRDENPERGGRRREADTDGCRARARAREGFEEREVEEKLREHLPYVGTGLRRELSESQRELPYGDKSEAAVVMLG